MSSTPPVHTIPQEVLGTILSNLGTRDTKNCALVCKRWTAEAHFSLGRYPLITSAKSADALKSHLLRSLDNRQHVKGLWLRAHPGNRSNARHSWIRTALIELAPFLPNLLWLTVQNWGPVYPGPEIVFALRSLPKVTKLELRGCVFESSGDLEYFVFSLPALSYLRLDEPQWGRFNPSIMGRTLRTQPLSGVTKLELWGLTCDPENLLGWFQEHQCRPRELVICSATPPSLNSIQEYLEYVGNTLEVFTFSAIFPLPRFNWQVLGDERKIVDLQHNQRLRSLTLWTYGSPQGDENSWLPELLRSAQGCSLLRHITFAMVLDRKSALADGLWKDVTDLLTGVPWRTTLEKVSFVHHPVKDEPNYRTISIQDAVPFFKEHFESVLKSMSRTTIEMMNAPVIDLGEIEGVE